MADNAEPSAGTQVRRSEPDDDRDTTIDLADNGGAAPDTRAWLADSALSIYMSERRAGTAGAAQTTDTQPADAQPTDVPPATDQQSDTKANETPPSDGGLRFVKYRDQTLYAGDFSIKRDVQPEKYVSPGGETLTAIARKHLGPGASAQEVQAHVLEIALINVDNYDPQNYRTAKDQTLRLPGHTTDGAVLFRDWRGTRFSITPDGEGTFRNRDGSGHTITPNDEGGFTKKYFGAQPSDNYTVVIGKDGLVVSNDRVDPDHRDAADLDTERTRLTTAADKTVLLSKENAAFRADMKQFEERAKAAGLGEKEIAQTYAEVSRLLELKGQAPLTDRERVRMALGIMRGAAEPTSNDQGDYNTCQVTVLENRLYTNQPSAVARTLADIATRSQFVAHDGTVVKMDPIDLRAHGQAAQNEPRGTWVRTYAS